MVLGISHIIPELANNFSANTHKSPPPNLPHSGGGTAAGLIINFRFSAKQNQKRFENNI